ncbi:MAG: ABC transporter permease [Thermoanaerobaculia bacterium]|nr:ABC transporter permease [Thermoanaerobaculia bacterium]
MSLGRDVVRDLLFFRRTHLAVAAGCAVASAVLAGALLVGDSVRTSLRQLTLERLGGVDHALAASRFFDEGAAQRLADQAEFKEIFDRTAPAILLRATAQHAESRARASDVGLQGVDGRFFAVYGAEDPLSEAETAIFPPVVLNQALADSLGADIGTQVLISLQRWSEVPSGSLLARDDTASVVETLRLEVASILPNEDLGSFGLQTHQSSRFNAFVRLSDLQDGLDQEGTVNSILVATKAASPAPVAETAWSQIDGLQSSLDAALTLDDFGILFRPAIGGTLMVESSEYVISPSLERAIDAATRSTGASSWPILTYLGNSIERVTADDSSEAVPYSTLTAADISETSPFGPLRLVDGTTAPALGEGQLYLNAWTAGELGYDLNIARPAGERVRLRYFEVGPREDLTEVSHELDLAGIVAMEGLAVDSRLSQEYPGIAGSSNMSDWDPPFPIDLRRIRSADEAYWDDFRGAPKAWVGLSQGQDLWETRWGRLTGVRLAPPEGTDLRNFQREFENALMEAIEPEAFGLQFQPVKALGVEAAAGPTDFGQLFLSMSFFVIVSAALLVALLFGLGVEQRAAEVGLRLAVGFGPKKVRKLLLTEGLILAAVGGAIGLVGAVGYAALLMLGLRTWWLPAVGTSRLELFVQPLSLVAGWSAALIVVAVTIALTVRRVGKIPTPRLLRGSVESGQRSRSGRVSKLTASIALCVAVAGLVYAFASGRTDDPGIFFVVGPSLLVGLLALFIVLLDRPVAGLGKSGIGALPRMAVLNSRRNRRRSLLSVTLIAFATFLIVTVAAFEEGFHGQALGRSSGTGGYELVAQADVPLQQDLASADGRYELGLPEEAEDLLDGVRIVPFRLRPGDDTSCLNLYKPGEPRILGVPDTLIDEGGFTFTKVAEGYREVDNPWSLLREDLGEEVIPMIGDGNSTQWILRLPVGGEMTVENERGEPVTLRLIATLATSVFQSEVLISEEQFLRHFPSQGGFPYFLIDTRADELVDTADEITEEVSTALEAGLARYGFDAVEGAEKLASFHAVQNTYLSTFRSLGGLGLLLGTVGLAVVLMRNVIERRGELATLRAFGYRKRLLRRLIVMENTALLAAGLAIGTIAALLTAGPKVFGPGAHPPWEGIVGTLFLIFVVGLAACAVAARGALGAELIPALKSEA